jgi:prefoldin subunit 5
MNSTSIKIKELEKSKHKYNHAMEDYNAKTTIYLDDLEELRKQIYTLTQEVMRLPPYYNDWLQKNPQPQSDQQN